MFLYKFLLVLNEGLIFGILSVGVYVAFQWVRFPDLTPDGSFIIGAAVYVKAVSSGVPATIALILSIICGGLAGISTASISKIIKVPPVVAGLLVSSSLYSFTWLLLGKPNQFLEPSLTLVGDVQGISAATRFTIWLAFFSFLTLLLASWFANSLWGIRLRGISENPLLAHDTGSSEKLYTFMGLALSNAIVSGAAALFVQRSYSADINMGIGITITGLAGVVLGLIISRNRRKIYFVILCVIIASFLYKAVVFLSLEAGMPAQSFRLVSSLFLVGIFFIIRTSANNFLGGLKWN